MIDLQTRHVQIGGVVRQPYGAWMTQVARNLTDGVDGFLIGKRYLLHDRDPLFTNENLAAVGRQPAKPEAIDARARRPSTVPMSDPRRDATPYVTEP